MRFTYRFFDLIGEKLNILIISPFYRSFGDSIEQIYFSILHCQAKKKKLVMIRPFKTIFFKKVSISNIYLYQLEHELIIKLPVVMEIFFMCIMSLFAGISFIHITIRKLIAKIFNLPVEFHSNTNLAYEASQHFGRENLYSYKEANLYGFKDWQELEVDFKSLELPYVLNHQAEDFISIHAPESKGKKWIILHVLDNTKIDFARGADIKNYELSINYLIKKGFHIFRIGDKDMPSYEKQGVTDLAHIDHEGYIDLYLIKNSFLMIATQSGPIYMPNLFKTNLLSTNLTDWSTAVPRKYGNFFINKTFYDEISNKRVPISKLLEKDFNYQVNTNIVQHKNILLIENSESEIFEALKDFLNFKDREEGYSAMQITYNEKRQNWLQKELINNINLKIHYSPKNHYKYVRARSIAQSSTLGTMSQSFLKKYWNIKN